MLNVRRQDPLVVGLEATRGNIEVKLASVIVKKSLEEGFGLGVTEAMWKRRPVIASRVGGHRDQIEDGVNGVLVDDPRDLAAFGRATADLLLDLDRAARLGKAGHQRVRERFLPDRLMAQWMELFATPR